MTVAATALPATYSMTVSPFMRGFCLRVVAQPHLHKIVHAHTRDHAGDGEEDALAGDKETALAA